VTRTRVLLVDDSLTVRRRLAEALATEADIEIAGEASDGRSAIDLCRDLRPDVVTMDMVLPRLSGLEATEEIMAFHPTPILVVSASINRGDLFKTYDALAAGAVDVLDKPSGVEDDAAWDRAFREAVRRVARVRVITHPRAKLDALRRPAEPKIPRTPPPVAKPRSEARVVDPTRLKRPRRVAADVVAVGASTGA
jgi:two-component system, chemotaxis family, protein-glutamate methylesterase/glutaminase